jgi:hypothetical protein
MGGWIKTAAACSLLVGVLVAVANPSPLTHPAGEEIHFREKTRHYYVWIADAKKWNAANDFAKRYSAKSKGTTLSDWHLATITDATENDFVFDVVLRDENSRNAPSFLGAFKQSGNGGTFTWVTGERFAYSNFAPGQPDFARENVLEMGGSWGRQWNDQDGPGSDSEASNPFILEHGPVRISENYR